MMQQNKKILVLGATGQQGGAVARHLLEKGRTSVHALVCTAESKSARLLAEQGITLELGDLDESATLRAAMQEAYGVFAVLPLDQLGSGGKSGAGAVFHLQLSRRGGSQ